MSQQMNWIPLDSAIYDYVSEAELSQAKYFKLFNLAYRCMEDLGLDFFYAIKSVQLVVKSNKTLDLPADFLQYTKFGALNGAGEIVPFKYNDKLTSFHDLNDNRLAQVQSSNFTNYYSFSSPVFFNFWNGSSIGNLYGLGWSGLYGGGFKIDMDNGVIILDPSYAWTNAVLEYVASPDPNREYRIPVQLRETVVAWLAWKDIANSKAASSHFNLGDKRDRRHEYFEARRKGIAKYRPFYLDQAYIASVEAQRLTVKV